MSIQLPVNVLSLGAGVQSSTLGAMIGDGLFPMVYCGVFADTHQEPASVYEWLSFLCGVPVLKDARGRSYVEPGIYSGGVLKFPIHIVSKGDLGKDALTERTRKDGNGTWVPSGIPHYSINSDGSLGHGPRQCTHDFKLLPILARQRELVGQTAMTAWRRKHKGALVVIGAWQKEKTLWKRRLKLMRQKKLSPEDVGEPPVRPELEWQECQQDALVISWIGMSADEAGRVKGSQIPWIRLYYPLFDMEITRKGCQEWMKKKDWHPPRSACIFCPYHSDEEWLRLKEEEPEEFERAAIFDEEYRQAKIRTVTHKGFKPYLHDSRKPLREVDFSRPRGTQLSLFENDCEGMCGV